MRAKGLDLYMPYPFSKGEYRDRLNRVRAEMARKKIDLLFLSAPESLFYISGYAAEWYEAQSPKKWLPASGIAIEVDHDNFIFFPAWEMERGLIQDTTVTTDARYFDDPTKPHSEDKTGMPSWIVKELKKEGWLPGTVGLEMWSYVPNRVVSEIFQKELEKEGGRVVDGTDIVRELRWIKSPQEIAYIEEAARIADIGMKAAIETMRPGMTELEVYGEIFHAMTEAGGENPALPILVHTGTKGGGHALASRRKIKQGDILDIDLCGVYNRYHANIARIFSIGKPHPDVAKRYEIILTKGFEVLSEVIRPNLPVAELNEAAVNFYKEHGLETKDQFLGGYELGIAFPPDWCGPYLYDPSIDPGDRLFVPGTVVNNEAWGINTIAFYKDRARILSELPNNLIII